MAAREFNLTFEAAPPANVRPAVPFAIPMVIAVRPIGTPASSGHHLVVNASLRDENCTAAAVELGGSLTASVISGRATFSSLMIPRPGRYRIRVMLSAATNNGVVTKEYVDSEVINVNAAA